LTQHYFNEFPGQNSFRFLNNVFFDYILHRSEKALSAQEIQEKKLQLFKLDPSQNSSVKSN